ncbi:MAG TPA: copper resistance protein CopC, partial [Acidimicrobiales bacterium]
MLLSIAAGTALALGPAGPAHAHAALESSVPAGASVLDTAPTDITLDFDEPVTAGPGSVRLIDSSGRDITLGASEQGADPTVVVTPVPEIPDGAYVVAWRVISQDGHPADGAFTFQVGRAGAIDTRDLIASVLSQQGGDAVVAQLATFNRLLTYAGLALAIGGAVFVVGIWPGAGSRWAARRVVWFGWGLLLIATVSTLLVAAPYLTGRSMGALDLELFRSVSHTRVVQMAELRLLLVLLALPLLLRLGRGLGANAQLAGVLLGELVLGTVALSGHGGSGRWAAVGVILDAVHLGAMAVWLGGLALLVVLLAGPASGGLAVVAGEDEGDATGEPAFAGGTVGAAMAVVDERSEA